MSSPAPAPPVPEPVLAEVPQAAPEPYADQAEEPEPEYHATRIEPAVSAYPSPPLVPDPYAHQAPPLYLIRTRTRPRRWRPIPMPPGTAARPRPGRGTAGRCPGTGPHLDTAHRRGARRGASRDPLPLGAEAPEAKDLGLVDMPSAMVEGVYCKNGHFNDPEARNCAVCGIGMGHLTKMRQKGARPPLGVLILGDGSVCQLDADYVIGREPNLDSAVAEGRARPLRLMDASGVVSRIHARVELDGWQVFITDLNSANGTQVLMPGERNPMNLQPGVRAPLVAGAQIRLGGEYGLQYDSHRQR